MDEDMIARDVLKFYDEDSYKIVLFFIKKKWV